MFERPEVNHRLQLILTIVTLGLWGISWLALCARGWLGFWECRTCHGMKRLSAKMITPKDAFDDAG
jgi:hypothetical protein